MARAGHNEKAFLIRLSRPTLETLEQKADEMGIATSQLIRALCIEYATGQQIIARPQSVAPQAQVQP